MPFIYRQNYKFPSPPKRIKADTISNEEFIEMWNSDLTNLEIMQSLGMKNQGALYWKAKVCGLNPKRPKRVAWETMVFGRAARKPAWEKRKENRHSK